MAYQYTECGLSNVIIHGLDTVNDDAGEKVITIPAINELHKIIALGIVSHAHGISGDEMRFLRSELGFTQAELGNLVHKDKQTIGRWERSEIEIDSAAETVIRRLAIENLGLKVELSIEELSRKSIPTVMYQPIDVTIGQGDAYELAAA